MNSSRLVRDDFGAKKILQSCGLVVPPIYEVINDAAKTEFRQCFVGWRVVDTNGKDRGAAILFSSVDGEDYEILADGGWTLDEIGKFLELIFINMNQYRVTARCKATSSKEIRFMQAIGFKIEGVKRLEAGNIILFGMLKSECKLLGRGKKNGNI
jgi:hypothetical protein